MPTPSGTRPPASRGARPDGRRAGSLLDRDPVPEGDPPGDRRGGVLRRRIEPRGIAVHLVPDDDVVVAGGALPAADGVRLARPEMRALHRVGWKVLVALDHLTAIALRDHRPLPDRLHGHSFGVRVKRMPSRPATISPLNTS